MKRRDFLKAAGLACFSLSTGGCNASSKLQVESKPNIVIILADDMGFSDIGCYGGEIDTPTINRLADNGLRFTQFYNTGRCCPTRAALLTGLYSHQAGVGDMSADWNLPGYRGRLNKNCVTIAEALKPAGYRCYAVGKWHVGPTEEYWPLDRGFDRYYGANSASGHYFGLENRPGRKFIIDDKEFVPDWDPIQAGRKSYWKFKNDDGSQWYGTNAYADNALKFLDEHAEKYSDRPFFLYAAFTAPHWPVQALPKDIEKYKGKYKGGWDKLRAERHSRQLKMGLLDKKWPLTPRDEQVTPWDELSDEKKTEMDQRMAVYAAMIDCMDQNIGRIVEKVKLQGKLDNTLIMFLSDNGGCHEGGPWGFSNGKPGAAIGSPDSYDSYGRSWANASNTPFRLYKHWVHEGGISTPLIVHWPNVIKQKGKLTDQAGHVIDLMATCCDAAGTEYPTQFNGHKITPLEGKSLLPVFQSGKRPGHDAIFWEHEGNKAVRVGDWKLVSVFRGGWELYNIKDDRTEMTNLAQKYPDKVDQMKKLYQAWTKRSNVIPKIKLGQMIKRMKEKTR